MTEEKKENSRRSPRYFYVTPLQYKGSGSYENLDALSINISEGGIYFQSTHDFPVGHTFILNFQIPGNSQIFEASCEVIHRAEAADGGGFAIGCHIKKINGISEEKFKEKLVTAFGGDPDRLY